MSIITRRSFFLLPVLPFLAKVKPKVVVLRLDSKAFAEVIIAELNKGYYQQTFRVDDGGGFLRDMKRASAILNDYGEDMLKAAESVGAAEEARKNSGKLGETSGKSG